MLTNRGTVHAEGPGSLRSYGFNDTFAPGFNVIVVPASGQRLRIYYLSYNPVGASLTLEFIMSPHAFLVNAVPAGSIIMKDFGDFRYLEGDVDAPLYLDAGVGGNINVNVLYQSVP